MNKKILIIITFFSIYFPAIAISVEADVQSNTLKKTELELAPINRQQNTAPQIATEAQATSNSNTNMDIQLPNQNNKANTNNAKESIEIKEKDIPFSDIKNDKNKSTTIKNNTTPNIAIPPKNVPNNSNDEGPAIPKSIAQPAKKDIKSSKTNIAPSRKYTSLMFVDKDINELFKILSKFKQSRNITIDGITEEDDSKKEEESLDKSSISVYLNSIMYISKNSWAIWVNDSKITNLTNGEDEISIISISPLRATLLWKMGLSKWEIINANKTIPDSKFSVKDNMINLTFSLSPNQTYIPATNKTIEGRAKEEVQENAEQKPTIEEKKSNNKKKEEEDDGIFF